MVVHSEFSVLLWSKALVLDLDQAEQNSGKFFRSLPTTSLSLEITKVDIMAVKMG